MKMKPIAQVLIFSNPRDETTHVVAGKVEKLGGRAFVIHPEESGSSIFAAVKLASEQASARGSIRLGGLTVKLEDVSSIWYRRPRLPEFSGMKEQDRRLAVSEWDTFWRALCGIMEPCIWVSDPQNLQGAARKTVQAAIATAVGLRIPRTLITNDSQEVLAFYGECRGRVVAKPTGPGWVEAEDGAVTCFLTNRVTTNDIHDESALKVCPVTFQEEIAKDYEIRVNVVGRDVLAVKIESQCSAVSELDWRRYDTKNTPYSAYVLPRSVEDQCREITYRLGLNFGAIDLIRTPEGEYVFLEINGNGQFLWAELLSGVDVSGALAELLVGLREPLCRRSVEGRR
ncbi:MvdC/MvdD family ATP grasp protein [Streptomyces sp. NPDC005303]|uniref:MvdC/MvdD family ATP grasp protein n=1 Tax=Streptomyces sp. NPDC005303 TaxID=3155713 RepID=UPI00339E4DF6